MDLIGHCAVAELSGAFTEEEVYGPGIVELMFPNFAHCHDWLYSHCWNPAKYEKLCRTVKRLRAHMICDWVIHYGTEHTHIKKKCGWAFQQMKLADQFFYEFFAGAVSRGFLRNEISEIGLWNEKKRLDFAHSFVEYAVDLLLAPRTITTGRFRSIKDNLSRLSCHEGYGSERWVFDIFDQLNIKSDRSSEFILNSLRQIGQDATEVSSPEEFAIRTAAHKYGFCPESESLRYVQRYLEQIAAQLNEGEVATLCTQIGQIIQEPDKIYTGLWHQGLS